MIQINTKNLRLAGILYLVLPFCAFCLFWLEPFIGVAAMLLCGFAMFRFQRLRDDDITVSMSVIMLAVTVLVALIWCWTSGIGGFFYQSSDHHYRNAVFRDLIFERWPVVYENYGTGLVYYLGIWLIPALIGKIFGLFPISTDVIWSLSGVVLLVWCTLGIVLVILYLCTLLQIKSKWEILIVLLVFVCFSGMDVVGNGGTMTDHIEWWAIDFQARSNTTAMFWAYNQCIAIWLMIVMFFKEKVENYLLLGAIGLFYAPFPTIGLMPIALVMGYLQDKNILKYIKRIISAQNAIALFVIVPICYLYYSTNLAMNSQLGVRFLWCDFEEFEPKYLFTKLIVFILFEYAIHFVIIWKYEMKNPILYTAFVVFCLTSTINVGAYREVVFRISANMPAIFILMYYIIKNIIRLLREMKGSRLISINNLQLLAITIVLILGICTPGVEYRRAFNTIEDVGTVFAVADNVKTFNTEGAHHNFVAQEYKETIFYKCLARKKGR